MNKKIIYITIIILTIAVASTAYFMILSPTPDGREEKSGRNDRLAKTKVPGVEENINAYNIEDDLRITQDLKRDENEILALNPRKKAEILEKIGPKRKNTVLHKYNSSLPENIKKTLKYFKYNISYDYFLVTADNGAEIRENPDPATTAVARVENLDKVSLLQRVDGVGVAGSNIWYRTAVQKDNQINEGYLHSAVGISRTYRFEKMQNAVNKLKRLLGEGGLNFISNYKNQNGTPPQEGDVAVDDYGYRVYHSAPAYYEANTDADYRYVPDGMLLRILDETDDFYHVNIPTFGADFYIPKQYIDPDVRLNKLNHVLVVDSGQQNQAAFEIVGDGLNLVSYTLATTGMEGDFSFKTSPGIYKAQEKRERFEYLKKGSEDIAGYAPYATRFSGGAYIHGVPVSYEEKNGEKIDPGIKEYIHTIGTFPRSSMCVRNFTSHAKFIYNWMDTRNGAVIVIE